MAIRLQAGPPRLDLLLQGQGPWAGRHQAVGQERPLSPPLGPPHPRPAPGPAASGGRGRLKLARSIDSGLPPRPVSSRVPARAWRAGSGGGPRGRLGVTWKGRQEGPAATTQDNWQGHRLPAPHRSTIAGHDEKRRTLSRRPLCAGEGDQPDQADSPPGHGPGRARSRLTGAPQGPFGLPHQPAQARARTVLATKAGAMTGPAQALPLHMLNRAFFFCEQRVAAAADPHGAAVAAGPPARRVVCGQTPQPGALAPPPTKSEWWNQPSASTRLWRQPGRSLPPIGPESRWGTAKPLRPSQAASPLFQGGVDGRPAAEIRRDAPPDALSIDGGCGPPPVSPRNGAEARQVVVTGQSEQQRGALRALVGRPEAGPDSSGAEASHWRR